jgi:hypothetical protein
MCRLLFAISEPLMKDVSAPILVGSRHWGGLRIADRA